MRMRARGFSLLEMLLVMALVAAASLLAVAAFGGGLQGMRMRDAARDVAAQLRYTRAVAISSGRAQDFVVDPASRAWQGAKGRHGTLPEVGSLVFTGAREIQPEAGRGAVRFFPDGASTGGRLRMTANGGGWDIDVGWLTGEVRVRRVQESP